jgi:hypothetical protein
MKRLKYIGPVPCLSLVLLVITGFPCWAQQQATLSQIVANVKANEQLYKNIDVSWQSTYLLGSPEVTFDLTITRSETKYRSVTQQNLFHVGREGEFATKGGKAKKELSLSCYDGDVTRILSNDVANVAKNRVDNPYVFRPHTWIVQSENVAVPFSLWLTGGKTLQAHPLANPYRDSNVKVKLESMEKIDVFDCVKICHEVWSSEPSPSLKSIRYFWLVPERNYLPVKYVAYSPTESKDIPISIAWTSDFREISAGIWLPFKSSMIVNDNLQARTGKSVVSHTEDCEIEQAKLDPHYDLSFYRDVVFPPGTLVYDVNTKNMATNSYVVPGNGQSYWWLYVLIALSVIVVMWFYLVRRKRRLGATA